MTRRSQKLEARSQKQEKTESSLSCILNLASCFLPLASCLLPIASCLLLLASYSLPLAYAETKPLAVAAASDLSFALKEIAKQFEINTGTRVVLSFGSTGMLARQIENGAPFDIFFAANEKYLSPQVVSRELQ
ncbi:MAG: molybdate ABC transporter substrate-binding protein [Deltaproteobacteria bacterium]|nr:molybdate ABC transporter substrate-binding protein [Deltaproteobacteria bacterium]